jgi:predicted ATPase/DNA-binding CsgD family transcriptional regulator
VADVCALLGRPAVRLLTLVGPGGIGKTRLLLAVAEALRSEFPNAVYYLALAGLTDARLVLPMIAQALGVREMGAPGRLPAIRERLQSWIGQKKLLLVLDNFEPVIDAAADVAELLNACPQLKVLVTSREMLRLSAEHCYPVPPLVLPDLQRLPPLKFLAQVEAVRLFVTRAQAVQPDFELTTANALAVATICRRLDGLPLAIELAAARGPLLPPEAMLARLERRLPWLTGGARDAPPRHRTLRAAIAWSYDLLEPDEQRLFRRLGVFAGSCTLDAAAAVCDPDPGVAGADEALLQGLASLVHKSLLRQGPSQPDQGRLSMLETIREYALEQLEQHGEAERTRRAHAQYFLALAEQAEPQMSGPHQPEWLERLEQEHDNLRAALSWAAAGGDEALGARLAASLGRFWLTRGHMSEGRRWLEAVLAPGRVLAPVLRARALNAIGRLAVSQGDYTAAQALLEESLHLWQDLADPEGELLARNNLGLVAMYQSDFIRAQRYIEQSLAEARASGDTLSLAQSLNRLGLILRYQGDFDGAATAYEEGLRLARQLQDYYLLGAVLHNLGHLAHHRGDNPTAHGLLVESLLQFRQISDRPIIAVTLGDLAGVWATVGQPERAARLFGAAEALRDQIGAMMYAAQQAAYEHDVAQGAAQLDPAAWAAAWTAGRAMSLEAACALAMEDLPAPAAEAPAAPLNPYALSEREREVLRLLVDGLTYAQIAAQLILSFHTVHAHVRSIYTKLGVTSRNQATRFATEHGLV